MDVVDGQKLSQRLTATRTLISISIEDLGDPVLCHLTNSSATLFVIGVVVVHLLRTVLGFLFLGERCPLFLLVVRVGGVPLPHVFSLSEFVVSAHAQKYITAA